MEYVFSFNGRMMLMLGVVLALLMALSFGLGMLYGQSNVAPVQANQVTAPVVPAKKELKEETK
jgi:hypothetical protein